MNRTLLRRVGLAVSMVIAVPITGGRSASAAPSVVESSSPLVFFRTFNRDTSQLLRRVFRVDPRTERNLSPVALPPDFRSFVDAVQVGNRSFVVWTSKRDRLSLGAAGPDGRIVRRWPVGSAGGFEVRPVPDDPTSGTGSGFLRVSSDRRTALLVNGRGRRFGRYVDLRSGAVHNTPLPNGISGQIAEAAAIGSRFVLVGNKGSLVTVGQRGNVVARGSVNLPATGPDRIDLVDIVALSANRALLSYVTPRTSKAPRRRFVVRYNPRSGATRVTRKFTDPGGEAFAATATRFEVFGADPYRWIAGRIDGGPLRAVTPAPPGPPPAGIGIEPDAPAFSFLYNAASAGARGFVLRVVDFENVNDMSGYAVHEVLEVEVATSRVLRRTRFGEPPPRRINLPYPFDIRIS